MQSPDSTVPEALLPWTVQRAHLIYQAPPWITLYRQTVSLPDGRHIDDYHSIDLGEHVCCCVQTEDGRVIFVRHYRHGAGRVCLGMPAGMIEPGEEPLRAAQRELREETGYQAQEWESLGVFVEHGNYGCGKAHFFKAKKAVLVCQPQPGDLEEMRTELLTRPQVIEAIRRGDVPLMGSVANLALALLDWDS